jgi:hypothetical protein
MQESGAVEPVEMLVQVGVGASGGDGHFNAAINVSTAAGVNGLPVTLS